MPDRDPLFATLRKFRNVFRNRIVDQKLAALGLLRDGDRRDWLPRRKPKTQRIRSHRHRSPAFPESKLASNFAPDRDIQLRAEVQSIGDAALN